MTIIVSLVVYMFGEVKKKPAQKPYIMNQRSMKSRKIQQELKAIKKIILNPVQVGGTKDKEKKIGP